MRTTLRSRGPRLLLLALWPLLAAAGVRADQPAIRAVLDQMQRAVLAGDAPAYLLHVSPKDPIFRKEQENWAADLRLHVPTVFELSIVEPPAPPASGPDADAQAQPVPTANPGAPAEPAPSPESAGNSFGPDRAWFTLKTRWQMPAPGRKPDDDAEPKPTSPREVAFRVMFVREGEAWRYAGEAWETLERPADATKGFAGVRVRYDPGLKEVAEMVADLMPEVRSKVDGLFGTPLAHVQEVKLYNSMKHLQHSIYLSYSDGLSGWNEPGEAVKILSRGSARPATLRTLLGHEYGHVANFELGPKATDSPWWILEGVANLCGTAVSGGQGDSAVRRVIRWRDAGELADWSELTDFRTVKPRYVAQVYTQGEHFVRWFTSRHGDEGRTRWLRLMAQGQTLDEATKGVAGVTFAEADAAWRKHVEQLEVPNREDE